MRFPVVCYLLCLTITPLFAEDAPQASPEPPVIPAGSSVPLVAGESFILSFPELAELNGGEPPECEVRLPETYTAEGEYPLLVWFAGWRGSSRVDQALELVDASRFIVVALPYPENRRPRIAVKEGRIQKFWEMEGPMLQSVRQAVPNIDPKLRVAGGASSGAHLVGSGLDLEWDGFSNYFTHFVMHEGGYCPNMMWSGLGDEHKVLVIYGENSKSRPWQEYFMKKFKVQHPTTEFVMIPGAEHGMESQGKSVIRDWLSAQDA